MKSKEGLIYVFEGYGKGKTSAALGVTVRMLLLSKSVVWVSWFKEESWKMAEIGLPKKFKNIKMYWTGNGFYGGPDDHSTLKGHKEAALAALVLAKDILNNKVKGKTVDLLVLDEVIRAVNDNLIKIDEVLKLLKIRGKTHVVLTGHDCPAELLETADLVTEMRKRKHPYDKGVLAIRGLDF